MIATWKIPTRKIRKAGLVQQAGQAAPLAGDFSEILNAIKKTSKTNGFGFFNQHLLPDFATKFCHETKVDDVKMTICIYLKVVYMHICVYIILYVCVCVCVSMYVCRCLYRIHVVSIH